MNKTHSILGQFRQGDVLIERNSSTGAGTPGTAVDSLVLASGEATGHHHVVEHKGRATLFELGDGELELDVKRSTRVIHEEHNPIALQRGRYRVRRQREYSPEAIRNVAD